MKKLYPIFLNLTDRTCIVVGGGSIALNKAGKLADSGASLKIVAPEICDEIKSNFSSHQILNKEYEEDDLNGCYLAVAATDDSGLNSKISNDCRKRGILVNAVDQPDDCDFYVPASIEKGSIQIAISTGGASPAMAGWIKRHIDSLLSERLSDGVEIISEARKNHIAKNPEKFNFRAIAFRAFFESDIWSDFLDGSAELSVEVVEQWISSFSE